MYNCLRNGKKTEGENDDRKRARARENLLPDEIIRQLAGRRSVVLCIGAIAQEVPGRMKSQGLAPHRAWPSFKTAGVN